MKTIFKHLAGCVIGFVAVSGASQAVASDPYPSQVVRLVVGQSAGGSTDVVSRLVSAQLTEMLGKPVIVENRTGSAGSLAANYVSKAKPDGHTLLVVSSSYSINPALSKLPFDPRKDLKPVTLLAEAPFLLVTRPGFSANSVQEVLKMNGQRRVKYASGGSGSSGHMAGALLEDQSGQKMLHVPYKGAGPALNDVVAGHVDVLFASVLSSSPYIESGKLKAIGVTTAQRSKALPNVRTIAESGVPNYRNSTWYGVLAPGGTPDALVQQISQAFSKAMQSPKVRAVLEADGAEPVGSSPAEFAKLLDEEMARWTALVAKMDIKKK